MLPEPVQVSLKVIAVFERLNIPYLIGGSLASAVYGMSRATADIDLVADIKAACVSSLVELLKDEFYIDGDMIVDAIQHTGTFNLVHLETSFKVDVFIQKQRPFDAIQMQRRISRSVGDAPENRAFFSTAEDIILAKLEWYRAGNEVSDRQWRDILGVMEQQGERLDFAYLERWAGELGVRDLLDRAIRLIRGINS